MGDTLIPRSEFILPQPIRTSDLLSLTIPLAISQLPARLHCLRGLPPTPPPTSSQPPTPRFPQRQHFPAATLIRTRQHQAHPQLKHAPESPVSKTTQPRSQEKFGPSSDSSTRLMTSPILTLPTRGRASVHRMRRRRRSLHNHCGSKPSRSVPWRRPRRCVRAHCSRAWQRDHERPLASTAHRTHAIAPPTPRPPQARHARSRSRTAARHPDRP